MTKKTTSKNSFSYKYLKDAVSFTSANARSLRTIYAPLCGPASDHLKSSITPFLSGDIKIDKFRYFTKPVSTEDLRQDVRNFFVKVEGKGIFSLSDQHDEIQSHVEIGQLWHKLVVSNKPLGVQLEALNFIPVCGENVELMRVRVTNISNQTLKVIPTSSIPVFARALANKHDHEHVTSLLHRIEQMSQGVVVVPTMRFNEEGHTLNETAYYVFGFDDQGQSPCATFATVQSFYGDGGTAQRPQAVFDHWPAAKLSQEEIQGKEAVGALRFESATLKKGESKEYFLLLGIAQNRAESLETYKTFDSKSKFDQALSDNQNFWREKTESIRFVSADGEFDSWMRWVVLQPVLRRIFGCSFLPDHDYGKGGKGWRDLWQDLLSLILIEPQSVRDSLLNNFGGIRIDGTNATIIGTKPGEFIADRNNITRVWMDHGVWPFMTALLYIHQTGDFDILLQDQVYFRDPQLSRTFKKDTTWTQRQGHALKSKDGEVHKVSILEHILVQNLVQFFNVGAHNITRLESADWNDGLDMAFDRGESVAFMSVYAGNLLEIADLIEVLADNKKITSLRLSQEVLILLDSISSPVDYNDRDAKKRLLFDRYCEAVQPQISGKMTEVNVQAVIQDLRGKAQWAFSHIRKQEKISVKQNRQTYSWFNGYYDNQGERVEGIKNDRVRMTLTGQVFPIMSGVAQPKDIQAIFKSAQKFLKDPKLGGFRLNTDFDVKAYLDLGRAFGFAFGTKENGAFFSHMTVMFAYALYKQGFAKEGHEVLDSIYQMAQDTQRSKIYPGIPEYFDSQGKGMYHYLTGSASWLVLTELTQVFGVRGYYGDLMLAPQLVLKQFDKKGNAKVSVQFAQKVLNINYLNPSKLEVGQYKIKNVQLNGQNIKVSQGKQGCVIIGRNSLDDSKVNVIIDVILG